MHEHCALMLVLRNELESRLRTLRPRESQARNWAALCLCVLSFQPHSAFSIAEEPAAKPKPFYKPLFAQPQPPAGGSVSFVEWNPADLVFEKLSFAGEYLIVDGFAFGGQAEFQRQAFDNYRHTTSSFGVSATQYFETQTLKGSFLRAEMGAIGSVFEATDGEGTREQAVYGLVMGADLGYRFQLSERITGSASYGARRVVPDFFLTQGDTAERDWNANNRLWTMKVKVGLGVSL